MKHLRSDYDRIQDPAGKIGEDEPVFLLRGRDVTAPDTIRCWVQHAAVAGAKEEMLLAVGRFANYMEDWQKQNGAKIPDADPDLIKPELQLPFGSCPGGSC